MATTTSYRFRHKATGEFVHLSNSYKGYELTLDSTDPLFVANSNQELAWVLTENRPLSRTSEFCPGWGEFAPTDLEPICITQQCVEVIAPVELEQPRVVRTVQIRHIPYILAKNYAKGDLPQVTQGASVVFWLVSFPEGISFEDAKAWEGQFVYGAEGAWTGSPYLKRKLFKVVPVPEELEALLMSKQGAVFLASEVING